MSNPRPAITHYVQVTDRRDNEAVWRFRGQRMAMLCARGAALSLSACAVAFGSLGAPGQSLACGAAGEVAARLHVEGDDGGTLELGFATPQAADAFRRAVVFSPDVCSVAEHRAALQMA